MCVCVQCAFLVQVFMWTFMRSMFFSKITGSAWPIALQRILYWFPMNFEFSTFSLLTVFWARIVHSGEKKDREGAERGKRTRVSNRVRGGRESKREGRGERERESYRESKQRETCVYVY